MSDDRVISAVGSVPQDIDIKYLDMGDGTHAQVVAIAGQEVVSRDDGVEAAINGDTVCNYVNSVTPGVAQTILTNASLVVNIPSGRMFMLSQLCMGVLTTNDDCSFEVVGMDAADGAGNVVFAGPAFRIVVGNVNLQGLQTETWHVTPPVAFRHSDGFRSVTFRVDANDAGCQIQAILHGYYKDE